MTNLSNSAYTGPVYFGSPMQEGTPMFVYDSGSGWLTTTSTSCSNCEGSKYYNPAASDTYDLVSSETVSLSYGSATLDGLYVKDNVCLSSTTCVADFEFFMIEKEEGLQGLSGILGMSPVDEEKNGPSYVKALYDAGTISEEKATFWLN